jgi:hypothetical protein
MRLKKTDLKHQRVAVSALKSEPTGSCRRLELTLLRTCQPRYQGQKPRFAATPEAIFSLSPCGRMSQKTKSYKFHRQLQAFFMLIFTRSSVQCPKAAASSNAHLPKMETFLHKFGFPRQIELHRISLS